MHIISTVVCVVVVLCGAVHGLDNGLALTPPMGWLSWERYTCQTDCVNYPDSCISENLYLTMGQLLVKLGLKDVGYNRVNIDDCWPAGQRAANGSLVADPVRFPHGIKWLADQLHAMGLEIGIYSDMGNLTCGGYPGSLQYLKLDADTFASWGIDSLKMDGCYGNDQVYAQGYPEMTTFLNTSGRQILYSCSWPAYLPFDQTPWATIAENCNLWRLYDDIYDSWDSLNTIIQFWAQQQDVLAPIAGPGHWNDPDQLIIGDFGLSDNMAQLQFAIWAIIAAPLYMSNNLRTLTQTQLDILMNTEIIAVNQDPLGIQGRRVQKEGALEVWARPLHDGSVAVVCMDLNGIGDGDTITFNFTAVGLPNASKVDIRDLIAGQDLGTFASPYSTYVNLYSVQMFRLTPVSSHTKSKKMNL